jgi:hypothetical protein
MALMYSGITKLAPRSPASFPMGTWWRSRRSTDVIGATMTMPIGHEL